jgi:hypothetical protein
MDNQHLAMWPHLRCTQRQARELISSPSLDAKTRLLSVNKTKSKVLTGLLIEHNTLKRHNYYHHHHHHHHHAHEGLGVSCSLILKMKLIPPISSSVVLCSFVLLVYIVELVLVTYLCPSSVRVVATFHVQRIDTNRWSNRVSKVDMVSGVIQMLICKSHTS